MAHSCYKVATEVVDVALLVQEELLVFVSSFRAVIILKLEALDLDPLEAHLFELLGVVYVDGDVGILRLRETTVVEGMPGGRTLQKSIGL